MTNLKSKINNSLKKALIGGLIFCTCSVSGAIFAADDNSEDTSSTKKIRMVAKNTTEYDFDGFISKLDEQTKEKLSKPFILPPTADISLVEIIQKISDQTGVKFLPENLPDIKRNVVYKDKTCIDVLRILSAKYYLEYSSFEDKIIVRLYIPNDKLRKQKRVLEHENNIMKLLDKKRAEKQLEKMKKGESNNQAQPVQSDMNKSE